MKEGYISQLTDPKGLNDLTFWAPPRDHWAEAIAKIGEHFRGMKSHE